MSDITGNIARLFSHAETAMSSARTTASRIGRFNFGNVKYPSSNFTPKSFSKTLPKAFGTLEKDDNSDLWDEVDAKVEGWVAEFFPELTACLASTPEQWLCGIITGQEPLGLSSEVFEAVWNQARDREYKARSSAVRQLRSEYSARGFKMPPGAMIRSVNQAELDASDAIAEVNVVQAIKDSEIKLDMLKFAVEQASSLKLGIMQALASFHSSWVSLSMKNAYEGERLKIDAYATLNSALSEHFNIEAAFENLRLKAEELRLTGQIAETDGRIKLATQDEGANAAHAVAARAFGDISAAAASAAGTLQTNIFTGAIS